MTTAVFDYIDYWALTRPPFALAPCPENLFLSKQHRECLLRLKFAVLAGKGGALLISENAGDGKTTVLRRLCTDLEAEFEGRAHSAFIDHPTLTPLQMIQEISRQLGVDKPYRSKMSALNQFRERLVELNREGGKCVVIVDEGQMLAHRPDLLQELRILLNFCVSESFLLSFILSGQRPLEGVIRSMPEFWQRLPVRFFLGNLDFRDTRELIRHRLRTAGLEGGREIFTRAAYEQIYKASQGCPRVICSIADLALVVGRSLRVREIDAPEVLQATADMEKRSSDSFHYYHFLRSVADGERKDEAAPAAAPDPQDLTDELFNQIAG
ncbi:MAG TPA: AAA family ATPase [Planctomycetota bacterium]|nr:AAA family ATPase [Planctomycetota bacterium]